MENYFEYIYKTTAGQNYPVEIGYKAIDSKMIIHDYANITNLCRRGCKNFNSAGGCPPRAPKFEEIKHRYGFGVLLYGKLYSKYKPQKVMASTRPYIHYRFQDLILSNLLNKLGNQIMAYPEHNIILLSNGYCMGCGSKKCNFKSGQNVCRNPMKRTFSLEATGINVELSLKSIFGIDLQWYNKSNYNEVEHMTKVIGIFCLHESDQSKIFNLLAVSLDTLPCTKSIIQL